MDLIMDPEKTPEEILLESFYVLKELHRNMPLTTELVEDYFSEKTIHQLERAISEIDLPVLDTMDECNELLQDLGCKLLERRTLPEVSGAGDGVGGGIIGRV